MPPRVSASVPTPGNSERHARFADSATLLPGQTPDIKTSAVPVEKRANNNNNNNNNNNIKNRNSSKTPSRTASSDNKTPNSRGENNNNNQEQQLSPASSFRQPPLAPNHVTSASTSYVETGDTDDNENNNNNSNNNKSDSEGDADEEVERASKQGSGSSSGSESTGALSGSSGASGAASSIFKKRLYCGCLEISTLMTLIVLIPIIFLVVYSSIPLDTSLQAVDFLKTHNPILDAIFNIAVGLESERRGAIYLTAVEARNFSRYPVADTQYFYDRGNLRLNTGRSVTDANLQLAIQLIIDRSDSETKQEVVDAASALYKDIRVARSRFDSRTIFTQQIRSIWSNLIANCQRLILRLVDDDRLLAVHDEFMVLALLMRNSNSLNSYIDSVVSIVLRNHAVLAANMNNLIAMESVINRDNWMVDALGTPEQKHAIRWRFSPLWIDRVHNAFDLIVETDGNATAVDELLDSSWLNETTWDPVASVIVPTVHAQLTEYRNVVAAGKMLLNTATLEIIKMVIAVFVCIITTVIVVRLNRIEQERMNAAYEGTKQLAAAVQRFVPKNQLKLMGVRSVVEVSPGDFVETAVSLLFSDIRNFSGISCKLTKDGQYVALFEWLQHYFQRATKVVSAHHGYIDSMIGDAIFVVNNTALEGLETAMALQVSTDKLNLELVAHGGQDLVQVGCGLNFGLTVAGIFGDESRFTCTLVSPKVNESSRIEGLTKSWGAKILASEAAASRLPNIDDFMWRSLGKVLVQGSDVPIELYDFYSCDPVALRDHKHQYRDEFHEAVELVEADPEGAKKIFERIYNAGITQRKVKDAGCMRRFEGASVSPGSGALSFEKDGSLKGSPAVPSLEMGSGGGAAIQRMGSPNANNNNKNIQWDNNEVAHNNNNNHKRDDLKASLPSLCQQ